MHLIVRTIIFGHQPFLMIQKIENQMFAKTLTGEHITYTTTILVFFIHFWMPAWAIKRLLIETMLKHLWLQLCSTYQGTLKSAVMTSQVSTLELKGRVKGASSDKPPKKVNHLSPPLYPVQRPLSQSLDRMRYNHLSAAVLLQGGPSGLNVQVAWSSHRFWNPLASQLLYSSTYLQSSSDMVRASTGKPSSHVSTDCEIGHKQPLSLSE